MHKNSLASIIYQKVLQRSHSTRLPLNPRNDQQLFISNNKKESHMAINPYNKIIKITQFNSGLMLKQRISAPLNLSTHPQSHSTSPYKQFTVKKSKQTLGKPTFNSNDFVQVQLKRRDRNYKSSKDGKAFRETVVSPQKPAKLLMTSKWRFKHEIFDLDSLTNQISGGQSVVVVRPFKGQIRKQTNDKAILGKRKQIFTSKDPSKTVTSCRDRLRPNNNINLHETNIQKDEPIRRISASPIKRHNLIEQQKRYQQNIQRQKRQLLQMRKELNKNYGKPFNPPQNITAYAYIIYEADLKKKVKLNRISAKRQEQQGLAQIRKLFLHSHKVLASANSRTAMEMASLTKIMTCIVAIQIGKRLDLSLEKEQVIVGSFQQNVGGTSANIKKGQIYTVMQLLYGLMLPSGNDASLAVAVWGGKALLSREKPQESSDYKLRKRVCYQRFLLEMNSKAIQLSMQKTKYSNSHGLSNIENRSCCFDICILCEYTMNNPIFRQIVGCKEYECQIKIQTELEDQKVLLSREGGISRPLIKKKNSLGVLNGFQRNMELEELKDMDELQEECLQDEDEPESSREKQRMDKTVRWQNTHYLLRTKPQLYTGIKTGVTSTAGPCLASSLQINSRRFFVIVLNCKSMKNRMKDTQTLRKWLFQKQGIKNQQKISMEDNPTS